MLCGGKIKVRKPFVAIFKLDKIKNKLQYNVSVQYIRSNLYF